MWLVQGRTGEGLAWPEAGEGGLVFQALKGEGSGRSTPGASPERGLIHAAAGAGSDVDGRRALRLPESAREGEYCMGWMSERSEDCNTHKKRGSMPDSRLFCYLIREIKYVAEHIPHHKRQ